jgi:hypothetical protein
MEKRTFNRIPADLEFHCFNINNFGTVTNISEKGMFIKSQNIKFPLEIQFNISISAKEETLNIPVKVNRITKSNGYYDGMGVELLEQPQKYLKHIQRLRLALKNRTHPHKLENVEVP